MANLNAVGKRVRGATQKVSQEAWDVMKQVALAVHAEVVKSTPILTGKARSNWLIGVGRPVSRVIEPHRKTKSTVVGFTRFNFIGPLTQQRSNEVVTQTTIREGIKSLSRAKVQLAKSIYINNNVKYILALNDGSSRQAPRNFIQMGIDRGVKSVNNVAGNFLVDWK